MTSNVSSVVDAANAQIFSTRETPEISSQSQFAVGIDNFANSAKFADQNNNRVPSIALPK